MEHTERLQREANIWLATTRPDGRPHLVPVWFVWIDQCIYILTAPASVKAKNLLVNPRASVALENGTQPVIAECTTSKLDPPYGDPLVEAFRLKYDWDITQDKEYTSMFVLVPQKWLTWNA